MDGSESVVWFMGTDGNLMVRVHGRSLPGTEPSDQVFLILEAHGRRHRFRATGPLLSVAGSEGQSTFIVPPELTPALSARTWLQIGRVVVALPAGREITAAEAADGAGRAGPGQPELSLVAEHDPGTAAELSLVADADRSDPDQRLAAMARRVAGLENDLAQTRLLRDELANVLAERDRTRRIAEQRAHAEEAMRSDLARQLAETERESQRARDALGDLAAAEDRIRELEEQLTLARRRADEADQAAAVAVHERAPRSTLPTAADDAALRQEKELVAHHAPAPRVADEPPLTPVTALRPAPADAAGAAVVSDAGTTAEPGVVPGDAAASEALRHELDSRATAEASLRARLVDAEARLATRVLLERRTATILGELRQELESLGDALERERSRRESAELRIAELQRRVAAQIRVARDAFDAVGELRDVIGHIMRTSGGGSAALEVVADPDSQATVEPEGTRPQPEPENESAAASKSAAGGAVLEPERLSDALLRLREATAEPTDVQPADAEAPGAGAPPVDHDAPPVDHDAPPVDHDAPPVDHDAPPVDHDAPPVDHDAPPVQAGDPAVEAGAPATPAPAPQTAAGETVVDPRSAVPSALRDALVRPTVETAFRRLVKLDPLAAGRLLIELLPLPRVAFPRPVSYDLVLGPGRGYGWVSVPGEAPRITVQSAPRPLSEVDFRVSGEPEQIARLLVAGRLRRRLDRRVARVKGRRDALGALTALLGTPFDIEAFIAAGMKLEGGDALRFAACAIDPELTKDVQFSVAHQALDGGAVTYLLVGRGRHPAVTSKLPAGGVTTAFGCPGTDVLAVLAGHEVASFELRGDASTLTLLRDWLKAAQSG